MKFIFPASAKAKPPGIKLPKATLASLAACGQLALSIFKLAIVPVFHRNAVLG